MRRLLQAAKVTFLTIEVALVSMAIVIVIVLVIGSTPWRVVQAELVSKSWVDSTFRERADTAEDYDGRAYFATFRDLVTKKQSTSRLPGGVWSDLVIGKTYSVTLNIFDGAIAVGGGK